MTTLRHTFVDGTEILLNIPSGIRVVRAEEGLVVWPQPLPNSLKKNPPEPGPSQQCDRREDNVTK